MVAQTVIAPLAEEYADEIFKALASSHRRHILRILGEQGGDAEKTCCAPHEVCGCKLAEELGLVASTISHHMTILRDAGLVHGRKEGHWVYYSLDRERIAQAAALIGSL
ncbi:MAG: metalloregulator ArsR/SmtB family transcription factor [Coriobacteriia bacterium]|nr:metalloregulator ArsR/SmtB family transcription factor [Coriobacteriia bacterium]